MAKAAGLLLAVVLLSGVILKLMYATQLGSVVADAIPDAVWRALDAARGPSDGESAEDMEALMLAAVSFGFAVALVSTCALLFRRR